MSSVMEPVRAEASQRYFHLRDVRWADSGNGKDFTFEGKASIFGSWSEKLWTPRGFFRERIMPGAFTDVLARNPDVRLLKNHDKNLVLARTKAGTLDLEESEESLRVWARVARTSYAVDLRMSMERGDIDGMSFLFETDYDMGADDDWYVDDDSGEVRRDVFKVSDLIEVTIATFPAYAETEAVMREMRSRGVEVKLNGRSIHKTVEESKKHAEEFVKTNSAPRTTERITPRAYARCRQVVSETPWAIKLPYLDMIMGILAERMEGIRLTDEQITERIGTQGRDNEPSNEGSVAVIPLVGPIYSRAGAMQQISAAKSLDNFREQFRSAVNDSSVKAILLDVDSPGGTADMVHETAMEIRAARSQKPIVAIANSMAASAAYWIASACTECVVTPSGEVGSIGVYSAHTDMSGKQDMEGTKTTVIKAGKYKAEGNPFEPLTEEAKANIQKDVNAIYDMFVSAVARNRNTTMGDVTKNYGEGRTMMAQDALKAGMVDSVETFEQVLTRLQTVVGGDVTTPKANVYWDTNHATTGSSTFTLTGSTATMPPMNSATHPNSDSQGDTPADRSESFSDNNEALQARDSLREFLGLSAAPDNPGGLVSDASADDRTDGNDSLAALKARSAEKMQRARADKVRLTKLMLRKDG